MTKNYSEYMDEIPSEDIYKGLLANGLFADKLPPILRLCLFTTIHIPKISPILNVVLGIFTLKHCATLIFLVHLEFQILLHISNCVNFCEIDGMKLKIIL